MKTFLVRGVPASIQQDSWWMDGLIHCRPPNPPDTPSKTNRNRMLGDVLLWGVLPGVSLVAFAVAVLLSGAALPEIRKHAPGLYDDQSGPYTPYAADWREWGFRDWRTLRSLAALNATIPDPAAQPSTQGEQTSPTY